MNFSPFSLQSKKLDLSFQRKRERERESGYLEMVIHAFHDDN